MAVEVTPSVTLNGGQVDLRVREDVGADGEWNNEATLTDVQDGTGYDLSSFSGGTGNAYDVEADLYGTETSTPVIQSVSVDTNPVTVLSGTVSVETTTSGSTFARTSSSGTTSVSVTTTGTTTVRSSPSGTVSVSSTADGEIAVPLYATTKLPDAQQPSLGNNTEDEVAVNWVDVIDYGDYRIQIRETGQTAWDSTATGYAEQVVGQSVTSTTFTGREDGEEYEVRMRTETEHKTGAWTPVETVITKLPAPSALAVDSVTSNSVSLSWTDNSDNEDGFRVIREEEFSYGYGPERVVKTVGPNTTTATDSTAVPGTSYRYSIEAFTEETETRSGTVTTTTNASGFRDNLVNATGWTVEVVHSSGAVHQPEVVGQPETNPIINDLPEIELPVPRDEKWQRDGFEDAEMRVWKDGERLPIDTMTHAALTPSTTKLTGRGGTELLQRARENIRSKKVHLIAEDLITDYTSYVANVDDPASSVKQDITLRFADSDTDFKDTINEYPFPNDVPLRITGTGIEGYNSALFAETEDYDPNTLFNNSASGDAAINMGGFDVIEHSPLSLDYKIPASRAAVAIRVAYVDNTHPGFEIQVDGTQYGNSVWADLDVFGTDNTFNFRWTDLGASDELPDLQPGDHSVTVQTNGAASDGSPLTVDCVVLYDTKYTDGEIYDENIGKNELLTWPNVAPNSIQVTTKDFIGLNPIVAGEIQSVFNNTDENQSISLSADSGQTWPVTANNSETVRGSFNEVNSLRARFTLSYYSNGNPPVTYNQFQVLDQYEILSDQTSTPIARDRRYDTRVKNILQDLAEDYNFVFEISWDDAAGSIAVEWTQIGQRTATNEAELIDYEIDRQTEQTIEKAVVYGGKKLERRVTFTANLGGINPFGRDNWVVNSETVWNPSNNNEFVRGTDYEVNWLEGNLDIPSTSSMTDGQTYAIRFEWKPIAEYTISGVNNPKSIVRDFPEVSNDSSAKQVAFYIVSQASGPIWEGRIVIPKTAETWSIVNSIDIQEFPENTGVLQVREIIESPDNVAIRLATRRSIEGVVSDLRTKIAQNASKL